jgi:shikimate kinase
VTARHVVLVGSMGAGKTTIGRLVAPALGRPFVDNDQVLEADGPAAADIARDEGVVALHERECRQLRAALASPAPAVVAAAASTVESADCRAALARHLVVWLHVDPATAASRHDDGTHRRDLGDDVAGAMRALAARRDPRYAAVADLVVDVDGVSAETAARTIVDHVTGEGAAG